MPRAPDGPRTGRRGARSSSTILYLLYLPTSLDTGSATKCTLPGYATGGEQSFKKPDLGLRPETSGLAFQPGLGQVRQKHHERSQKSAVKDSLELLRCKKGAWKKENTVDALKCFNLARILTASQFNLETPDKVGMEKYMEEFQLG
eukprot:scaffold20871_cov63-Cyclotella_meneghiniana.AAC.1